MECSCNQIWTLLSSRGLWERLHRRPDNLMKRDFKSSQSCLCICTFSAFGGLPSIGPSSRVNAVCILHTGIDISHGTAIPNCDSRVKLSDVIALIFTANHATWGSPTQIAKHDTDVYKFGFVMYLSAGWGFSNRVLTKSKQPFANLRVFKPAVTCLKSGRVSGVFIIMTTLAHQLKEFSCLSFLRTRPEQGNITFNCLYPPKVLTPDASSDDFHGSSAI